MHEHTQNDKMSRFSSIGATIKGSPHMQEGQSWRQRSYGVAV